jgi:hypothetical protein
MHVVCMLLTLLRSPLFSNLDQRTESWGYNMHSLRVVGCVTTCLSGVAQPLGGWVCYTYFTLFCHFFCNLALCGKKSNRYG